MIFSKKNHFVATRALIKHILWSFNVCSSYRREEFRSSTKAGLGHISDPVLRSVMEVHKHHQRLSCQHIPAQEHGVRYHQCDGQTSDVPWGRVAAGGPTQTGSAETEGGQKGKLSSHPNQQDPSTSSPHISSSAVNIWSLRLKQMLVSSKYLSSRSAENF